MLIFKMLRRWTGVSAWLFFAAAFLAAVLLFPGCAGRGGRGVPPFYGAPLMDIGGLDASCLEGRRIVLDPGHGGKFAGAKGWGGLEEDDVNLGVALYLWGLLRDAGAEVLLTRSSDIDFLPGPEGELRDDLRRRMEIAQGFGPELFVSLHHNADISRSRKKNQIETYFKMLDEGPSQDAAEAIHKHLMNNLSLTQGEVVPGNYFVLRNAPCPAVLGEPSYLTNPWVEEKLKLAQKQLLEAQAYFAGIVEYFSRGTPRVVSLSPCDTILSEARPTLKASVSSEGAGVDPGTVTCALDRRTAAARLDAGENSLTASADRPLSSGTHELCFSFRNAKGNSSGKGCCRFEVSLPATSLSVAVSPEHLPREGGALVSAEVTDENGNPVSDGTPLLFSSSGGLFTEDSVGTSSGVASTVFFPPAASNEEGSSGELLNEERPSAQRLNKQRLHVRCGSLRESLEVTPSSVRTRALRIVAEGSGKALEAAKLWRGDSLLTKSTPQGLMAFVRGSVGSGDPLMLTKQGFIPVLLPSDSPAPPTGTVERLEMTPAANGLLMDTRVIIDVGADQDVSSEVGRRLAAMLAGAGAEILVLDGTVSAAEKVKRAELFGARRYFRIDMGDTRAPCLLHYPGSSSGSRLARACRDWWETILPTKRPAVREDAHYVLRHTSCPALILRLPSKKVKRYALFSSAIAYATYLAAIEDFGLARGDLSRLDATIQELDKSARAMVLLDEFVSLPIRGDGSVSFFCTKGVHSVRVVSAERKGGMDFVQLRKGVRTRHDLTLD